MSKTGATSPLAAATQRAVGYVRVSTKDQADNALSIAEQKAVIQRFCDQNGLLLVHVYKEKGASATSARRPALQTMLADAARIPRPFDVIVVFNLSRFFRNAFLSESCQRQLTDAGVPLQSATQHFGTGKEARFARGIFGLVDELASATNAEQVQLMMIANARAGWWNGSSPPFGYNAKFDVRCG